ncbi:hypothetical protein AcV5_007303 [Taiwanofungus camphoratus]|nr:hypothetical protein AcV5_007303 [Antrodia cinnamomea]
MWLIWTISARPLSSSWGTGRVLACLHLCYLSLVVRQRSLCLDLLHRRKAVPTGITTGLDIGLSNLSLKLITLSFYTMCKSSSLIFVLLFAFLFRLETFSFRLVGVITLIFAGVLLMVATETHFVLSGFVLVMSASALGGFRWSLTQLLLRSKNMGLDNPAATLFWLSPTMGITLAITSAIVDGWSKIFGSHFFDGGLQTLRTCFFLVSPGILAFCMVLSEFYIIQRAGVVPMSIAGIAKEVTTITISAWFFGDELTPLNITGVAITACGIALYTYHKYRKSMDESVPLDPHGNPIADDEGITNSSVALEDALPGERQRLRSDSDSRSSQESRSEPTSLPNGGEVLFDVGREDYNELIAEETSTATHEGTVWSPPYRIGDTQDLQTVWKEDVGAGDRS